MNIESSDGSVRCKRSSGFGLVKQETVQEDVRVVKRDQSGHGLCKDGDDIEDVPYDKGWAWMICLSCFMQFYVYASYDQVLSVLLVDILKDLDTTVYVMSVMFSVNTCVYCLSIQLTNNFLLNHITNRSLQTVAAIVNVLATLLFVIHPNSTLFLVASFIKATAKGTSVVPTIIMVGHYFKKRRALAVALGLIGVSVCSISVPPLTRYLRDEYGLRGCFLLVAGLEMHAVMATMVLRPISSYRKRRLYVPKTRTGAVNEEEKSLLSPKTVIKDNSTDPIEVTNTKESRALDLNISDEDAQLREGRDNPTPRKCNKNDVNSPACESPGGDTESSLIALGITNQNGTDLPDCCSFKKIPFTVRKAISVPGASCDGVVDSGSQLSGVSGLKDQDQAGGIKIVCCHCNKTPIINSLKTQPITEGFLETFCYPGACNEPDILMAIEVHITDTLNHVKNTLNKPVLDRKTLDIHITDKEIIFNSLSYDMQSNGIKTYDTEASFLQTPGIDAHAIQAPDLHVIQSTNIPSLDTQTPDQDKTNILFFENDRMDDSLTRSVPSRYHSASFSIGGNDLDIQIIAEDQTANEAYQEPKSGKVCNMTSWIKIIINFPLLKNFTCLTLICIYCLINGGNLNMMYLPSYARHIGIAPPDAAFLLTILGACDMAARILSGYFVDLKIVKVHVIMGVTIFCSGVVNHCMGLFHTFELLIFYVVIHGLIGCVGVSLDTVLIVETLGIGYLSKVLSMCSLFLNVSIAAQQLIVGALIEYTGNYVVAFQYVGSMYLLSSVLLLGLPIVTRLQQDREQKN